MTLTFELGLDILPFDLHAENVCPFVRESGDTHTDRQTHTHDVKTITPVADTGRNDEGKNISMSSVMHCNDTMNGPQRTACLAKG